MKNVMLILMVAGLAVTPALAVPTIQFNPGGTSPGAWHYDGAGRFSFSQDVVVELVYGDTEDSLFGSFVYIPDMVVSGDSGGPYDLIAVGPIEVKDSAGQILLSGTLGEGNLVPVGTIGAAYTELRMDITNVTVNNLLGSEALVGIDTNSGLDFMLSINASVYINDMLDMGIVDSGNFSGSMTVMTPAPGAIVLVSIGIGLVGWLRTRRRM